MKKIITIIFFFVLFNKSVLFSQIPTELNHLSNIIAKRLAARGEIDLKYFDKNHISSVDLNNLFEDQNEELILRSIWDINIPTKETSKPIARGKNKLFSYLNPLKNKSLNIKRKYFLKISSESTIFWMSLKEKFLFQPDQNSAQYLFTDEFTINGIIGQKLYINSRFSMFRHSGNHIWISNDYKGEWTKYFDEINTTFWYSNHTSLYLKGKIYDLEISNRPFSWGWSSGYSPLISANAIPFNRFSIYKKSEKFHFEYFHGSLNDKSINEIHKTNEKLEKFIAGHRLQYKPTNNFKLSISEIVVYGKRSPELGYLNPISFFWAQEHNLGDLDNILLAFDFGYRPVPGFIFYNALVVDELTWGNLFTKWWGNKFSYQFGIFLSSRNMKIPDLRFEYTSTRPWTFTHPDFSYTHRRSFIGAVNGPSSISYRIESFYYPTSKLVTQLTFEKILKGIGYGSSLHDNYDNRDVDQDFQTKFLLEKNYDEKLIELRLSYYLTNMVKIKSIVEISQIDNQYDLNNNQDKQSSTKIMIGTDLTW